MTDPAINDHLKRLEAELSDMTPSPVPSDMIARIEKAMAAHPAPWADRLLLSAMSLGALAACAVVALLWFQTAFSSPLGMPTNIAVQTPMPDDYPWVLAGGDIAWADRLK